MPRCDLILYKKYSEIVHYQHFMNHFEIFCPFLSVIISERSQHCLLVIIDIHFFLCICILRSFWRYVNKHNFFQKVVFFSSWMLLLSAYLEKKDDKCVFNAYQLHFLRLKMHILCVLNAYQWLFSASKCIFHTFLMRINGIF